jgi:hypothetical protein
MPIAFHARRMASGFTLIELLLAIGLGLAICYTAFAGLRVASQAVTTANRLSLENQLMRSGISCLLHELDTWDAYDHEPSGWIPLRTPGQAFARVNFDTTDFALDLDQSKPHTWFRGNMVAASTVHGNFPLFTFDGHPDWRHSWYNHWFKGMIDGLGYYGALDYMPCNSMIVYHDSAGSIPNEFRWSGIYYFPDHQMYNDYGAATAAPRDWGCLSQLTSFSLNTDTWMIANGLGRRMLPNRWFSWDGEPHPYYQGNAIPIHCAENLALLPQHPEHWPSVDVTVFHSIGFSRFNNAGHVVMKSPLNAQTYKLYIANTQTTLRGARRTRKLDTTL